MQIVDSCIATSSQVLGDKYKSPRIDRYVEGTKIFLNILLTLFSLPPFKELLAGIRNYTGEPQSQKGHYSYTHQGTTCDHSNSRQPSLSLIADSSEDGWRLSSHLISSGASQTPKSNTSSLQFVTLAKVGGSQYYSSPESNKKKEEDILSFLTWFLPSHATLNDCLNEMYSNLFKSQNTGTINGNSDILLGRDHQRRDFAIAREDFKNWVIEIPDALYTNISSSLERFTQILHELKIMKYNYMLENEIEARQRNAHLQCQHKQHNGLNNVITKEDSHISSKNTAVSPIINLDRDLTISPPPTKDKIVQSINSGIQKVRKPKSKAHQMKKHKIKCKHCDSIETPEWRRGPDGSRTLCNACGLFYSKLIKRYGPNDAVVIMKRRKIEGHTNDRTIPSIDALKKMMCEI